MEILRGGRLPELVDGWAATLAGSVPPAPGVGFETALLLAGLVCTAAAWHAQRPWLRGLVGEWKVRRLLQRHSAEAMHDVLLRRPDSTGWTQIDHLVRLPDRILVLETKNLGGRLTGSERDGRWTQRNSAGGASRSKIRSGRTRSISPRSAPPRAARCACRAWCCSSVRHGSMSGCPWAAIGRARSHELLREMQRVDRFGPTWESRVGAAWDRIAAAASGRLIDHWRHGTAIDLAYGRRLQLAGGLGLALAGGALLGLFLAG